MSMNVWDVFHDSVFQKCNPCVVAGEQGMKRIVRWVYTHERYDVTKFLSGGEMLIIEGSTLSQHADSADLCAYVDALNRAQVSALVMELVDYFTEVPEALVRRANEVGLPVIGLRFRMPFVTLCQEINTAIAREQLLSHLKVDNLSTTLAKRFSTVTNIAGIARVLADTLGEHVNIIAVYGEVLASEGIESPSSSDNNDITLRIAPTPGMPIATVVISQRMTMLGADTRRCITALVGQVLPPFINLNIREKIQLKLLRGLQNPDTRAQPSEIADADGLLHALKLMSDMRALPFAVRIVSWGDRASTFAACVDKARSMMITGRTDLILSLDDDLLMGCILSDDASWFSSMSEFGHDVMRAIVQAGGDSIGVVEGILATDAATLLNAIGAVRFASQEKIMSGAVVSVAASAFRRLLSIDNTLDAVRAFVSQTAGSLEDADDQVINTLCILADCMGNKTIACERLGIRRQTLYNRLERVEQLTGIPQCDSTSWSLALMSAKFIRALRDRTSAICW